MTLGLVGPEGGNGVEGGGVGLDDGGVGDAGGLGLAGGVGDAVGGRTVPLSSGRQGISPEPWQSLELEFTVRSLRQPVNVKAANNKLKNRPLLNLIIPPVGITDAKRTTGQLKNSP